MPKPSTYVTSPAAPTKGAILSIAEGSHIPYGKQSITFSIECCKGKHCYSKSVLAPTERMGFASKLHELSQLTWAIITNSSRHGSGYETLDSIEETFAALLPKGARLIGFVYHDYKRMVGYRDERGMFHIIGFDDGNLYKH